MSGVIYALISGVTSDCAYQRPVVTAGCLPSRSYNYIHYKLQP
jgi:hypothetical protein